MNLVSRKVFQKNKIIFWNINSAIATKQNVLDKPYRIKLMYQSEPFVSDYLIKSNKYGVQYISYPTMTSEKRQIELRYTSVNYFVNDIKFLRDWGVNVDTELEELYQNESINNIINQNDIAAVRLVC